jgi:hypothetical protein
MIRVEAKSREAEYEISGDLLVHRIPGGLLYRIAYPALTIHGIPLV